MLVIHVSFECYPVAKVGGLADVVGSLPKYLQQHQVESWVVMPRFDIEWMRSHSFETVHQGIALLGDEHFEYEVLRERFNILGFPIYFVDIPGKLDRPGIYIDPQSDYPYWDEFERFCSFQIAVLDWLKSFSKKPDLIHCHDHHTALIPFLMTASPVYHEFDTIPSIITIHNGDYQGWYEPGKEVLLPKLKPDRKGLLQWNGQFNALSAGVRTAWSITTVSESYLNEMQKSCKGLESLLAYESSKSTGILNGIDSEVWNPESDPLIPHHYNSQTVLEGKKGNKKWLCEQFELDSDLPLFVYIGRLAAEKGADLLPDLITQYLEGGHSGNFLILGTGDREVQLRLEELRQTFSRFFDASLNYDETLAHRLYAGADFLLMPSRVEPCGLNQMYAMAYGTIPVVRSIGGLRDTVTDISEKEGRGIRFDHFSLEDGLQALQQARKLFENPVSMNLTIQHAMATDFSWHVSAGKYATLYQSLIKEIAI